MSLHPRRPTQFLGLFSVMILLLFFGVTLPVYAEDGPWLKVLIEKSVLIVRARQVGIFTSAENPRLTFEVLESWRGRFDPKDFVETSPEGYLYAHQGEHGCKVIAGQEIIFFFSRHNQPAGQLSQHNTSLPVIAGKVFYTSGGVLEEPQEFIVDTMKIMIQKTPEIVLERVVRCELDTLFARNKPEDSCLIECENNRKGLLVGGSCFHACRVKMSDWMPPPGWGDCKRIQ